MVDARVKMYGGEIVISDAINTEGEPRNGDIASHPKLLRVLISKQISQKYLWMKKK